MDPEQNKARIRAFLQPFFPNRPLAEDEDIFALGLVNSLFAMQLVLFVEQAFEITVDDDDLDLQNFASVNAIAGLVDRKLDGRSSR